MSRLHLNLPDQRSRRTGNLSHRRRAPDGRASGNRLHGWKRRVSGVCCLREGWRGITFSPPSVAEEKQLGVEQLDQALRLACQVKIENHGEVVVMATARPQTRACAKR